MPNQRPETPIQRLRREMKRQKLDAFVVPRADEHQGEYVPPSAQRLAWLTGFTGSAGAAVVMADRAAIFVDGRYTLQVAAEVNAADFIPLHLIEQPPHRWLAGALAPGARLGYDPWLHTPDGVTLLRQACVQAQAKLVAVRRNPLDLAWTDRPAPPLSKLVPHTDAFAGRGAADKRQSLAGDLGQRNLDAFFLSSPESIAWLLNIRGNDVDFTPLPLAFALLRRDASVDLFVDPRKLSPEAIAHLGSDVRCLAPSDLDAALLALGGQTIGLDPALAPAWALDRLTKGRAKPVFAADPCLLPRACKNQVELEGARQAHLRDGAALSKFLAWLASEAPKGQVTELSAAEQLEQCRRADSLYQGPSFATIAGAGPNGAIVHYRSSPATNRTVEPGQIFLVDSGGQYLDGTTDVTRTVAIGEVGLEERRHFTLVLKGHIALAAARFPQGTSGSQLDALARRPLWAEGLDYDHGTGHGVGSYLSVHEGPQRIAKSHNGQPLLPGMILSDEPGYYKTGAYGIRIENLVAVRADQRPSERPSLSFEVLTLAPIDLALVERELLSDDEVDWLNRYHQRVQDCLTPLLDSATLGWLSKATRPI